MAYGGIAVHKKQRQICLVTEAGEPLPHGSILMQSQTTFLAMLQVPSPSGRGLG